MELRTSYLHLDKRLSTPVPTGYVVYGYVPPLRVSFSGQFGVEEGIIYGFRLGKSEKGCGFPKEFMENKSLLQDFCRGRSLRRCQNRRQAKYELSCIHSGLFGIHTHTHTYIITHTYSHIKMQYIPEEKFVIWQLNIIAAVKRR